MKTLCYAILMAALLLPAISNSQVTINELSATNMGTFSYDGDLPDWIELYNAGASDVLLTNYGLSDAGGNNIRKWILPAVTIKAGNFLLILADELDRVDANHWETAVAASNTWKYYSSSAIPDTNWRNLSFNDASWQSGQGGFGYGDGDDGTTISSTHAVLMRRTFNIVDTAKIVEAVFNMDFDDGYIAYINGVEIARQNVIGNRPNNSVYASASHEAEMYSGGDPDSVYLSRATLRSILKPGTNVLAVQTHDRSLSTDLTSNAWLHFGMIDDFTTYSSLPSWFNAPPKGYIHTNFEIDRAGQTMYLTDAAAVIIEQKLIPATDLGVSYGKNPNGSANWCFFIPETPGTTNNNSTCYTGICSAPVFSINGGFFTSSQNIAITTGQANGVIRYTLDGSEPTASSTLYTSPISFNSSSFIRAKVFHSLGTLLPSVTVTNSYFINVNSKLPVYSITMNPDDLYDFNTGIYVMGPNASSTSPYFGANFWQDWDRIANVEYFNKQKVRDFKFVTEISINGGYSRAKPQKSFELNLNDKYGTSSINYVLMPDKTAITSWDDWILRNAGTDWLKVHYRDALFEHTMKNTFLAYLANEPCVMYMNGDFFGVYWQIENDDHHFVDNNFGFNKDEIDLLKEGGDLEVKQGSDTGFFAMYNYATTTSPTDPNFYATMDSKFDLKNFADYFAVETYMNNVDWIGDWTNNIKLWRPTFPQVGKWKYLLYDLDQCMGLNSSYTENALARARNPLSSNYQSPMFNALCQNPTFKRYFINRYADLINTAWLPSVMTSYAYGLRDSIAGDMPDMFATYGSSVSTWNGYIATMVSHINNRPAYARNQIQSEFGLTSQVTLTLQTNPPGSGRIVINTITPTTLPWNGVYFNGNPVTITAIPNPGYTFSHWRSNVVISSNNPNKTVSYNFTSNDVITAHFTGSAAPTEITFGEVNYRSKSNRDAGDWIEVYNYGAAAVDMTGWYFRDSDDGHYSPFPDGYVLNPGSRVVFYEDSTKFKAIHPSVTNKIGPLGYGFDNSGENMRLFKWDNSQYLIFKYGNAAPWPTTPNGGGYTLELLSPTGNLNLATNWYAGCPDGSPGQAFVTCCPVIASASAGGPTTFCTGGNVVLTATAGSGYTFQWQLNGLDIPTQTAQTYTANASGNYTVKVSDGTCSNTTSAITVTVNTCCVTASISAGGPTTFCTGGNVLLTAQSGPAYTYQWKLNGNNIPGQSGQTYTANASGDYTVAVNNGVCTVVSNIITVVVNTPVAATITPAGPTTFCPGGSVVLNANTGSGLTHQWKLNTVDINLATSASYTANVSGSYTVVVTNGCGSSTSSAVVVNTSGTINASISATSNNICVGGSMLLTANPMPPGYTYQWRKNGGSVISTSPSHTASPSSTATYTVTITGSCGTVTSPGFVLNVNPIPSASFTWSGNDRACASNPKTLTANSGANLSYQWQRNSVNIVGAVNQTYVVTQAGTYRVIVTNAGGCSKTSSTRTYKNCRTAAESEEILVSELEVAAYPNPTTNKFTINISSASEEKITMFVYNVAGIRVLELTGINPAGTIEIGEELSDGIYFAVIMQGEVRKTIRLVKVE